MKRAAAVVMRERSSWYAERKFPTSLSPSVKILEKDKASE